MEYLIKPWEHQLVAQQKAEQQECYAFFFEPGCGKTGTTINTIRSIYNQNKRQHRTLILCPPIVIKNWKEEFAMHSKLDPSTIHPLHGEGAKRLATFKKRAWDELGGATHAAPAIFITNYESLLMDALFEQFLAWGPEILVLDESHRCKDMKAKRTKRAVQLADISQKRFLLSGTPILNSPMDIFAQYRILDKGKTFGKNFFAFRSNYFYDKNAGMPSQRHFPDYRVRPGALEEMNEKIYKKAMRVTKEECLDLPPLVNQVLRVGMTPEQTRLYNEMKKDLITFMNDKAVMASIVLTKALRLMQIASGYARTVDNEDLSFEKTPKMDALYELLEQLTPNHKVIVWAVFKENYRAIRLVCEALGVKYVEVHGDAKGNVYKNVEAFNTDPSVRVFIGHPRSGGIGINLVASDYSIFFSRNFSLEDKLQSEARNHRGGSEIHKKITHIDLVCEGTIEEEVQKKLANKIEVSEKILQDTLFEVLNLTNKTK